MPTHQESRSNFIDDGERRRGTGGKEGAGERGRLRPRASLFVTAVGLTVARFAHSKCMFLEDLVTPTTACKASLPFSLRNTRRQINAHFQKVGP